MTEFENEVLRELSVLKSQMEQLLGIGQPGRLHQLEDRVEAHERSVQRLKGMGAAFGALLTMLHLGTAFLVSRRQ
ncbi:MAG: hypothetical protein V4555_06790 [Acidobacteriota bacterium]